MAVDNSGWSIFLEQVAYDSKNMTGTSNFIRMGFIDSANTSIQVPETVYENLLNTMRDKEKSIESRNVDG